MTVAVPQDTESAVLVCIINTIQNHSIVCISFHIFLVALNCGEKSSQNNTYFESDGSEVGSCNVKICPMNSNICQVSQIFI